MLLLGVLVLVGSSVAQPTKLPPPVSKRVKFSRDVAPILQRYCTGCHGTQQQKLGLRLDRREDAIRGSETGPVIIVGNSANSRLIQIVSGVLEDEAMPPEGDRLTDKEVGILRAWIDQGVHWDTFQFSQETKSPTSQRGTASSSSHWAFQLIQQPAVPVVQNSDWVRNPIDNFVLAELEYQGIEPAEEAARTQLIRRVSLDLIGLPPTPAEVAAFLDDGRPDAYERLVDRLLDSPHYGEKWARYWLDLARYSDSDGYRGDGFRPHAWRYRHWVIDAFNRDMPFDQFTIEQIAGDLLPNATAEQKVATGVHRNTPSNREGGTDVHKFRFEQVINRINTVGTAWLALTVGCAQCHDHKYDPLTQKEYYQLFAFFNSAEEVNIDAPLPGEMEPYLREVETYRKKRKGLLAKYRVLELQSPWESKLLEARANPGKWQNWDKALGTVRVGAGHPIYGRGEKILLTPPEQRSERDAKILTNHFIQFYNQVVPPKVYKEELKFVQLRKELSALEQRFPALSQAQTIASEEKPRQTYIYRRGDFKRPGRPVDPGMPAFLYKAPDSPLPPRLKLAKWLVTEENPLTARVMVNRFWQELFGRGIVATAENFGTQGERPSHSELLDWLAFQFRDQGWGVKRSIRTIVLSATYRQSSETRQHLEKRDPENVLLARQSRLRLSAEPIRDSALAVSGLLDRVVGGKSVRPTLPEGARLLQSQWVESEGRERYRRGLYIQYQRMAPYPFMANFDAPAAYSPVCRRGRSNTPLQALNLLNDPVFFEAARALAVRVLTEASADQQDRLDHAFQICLARTPDPIERDGLLLAIRQQQEILAQEPELAELMFPNDLAGIPKMEVAAWVGASRILLNLDEFITRE